MSEHGMIPFHTLRFIGRMNAHISHDIKNVTATVSETAGLLEDLLAMQAAGKPVDPERFKKLCARIILQVERGNNLLGNMNVLAHSTDEPVSTVDVNKTLRTMADLARCVPYYRRVEFTPLPDEPTVTTRPYCLEEFIYLVYRAGFRAMPQDDALELAAQTEDGGCALTIAGLPEALDETYTVHLEGLAAALGAGMTREAGVIRLRLPATPPTTG